jgi:NADH:ubiquinone oxidoreductase subunit 4 (subunit M)
MSVRDGLVLVPLVLVVLAFGLYPQRALEHSAPTVSRVVTVAAPEAAVAGGVTP